MTGAQFLIAFVIAMIVVSGLIFLFLDMGSGLKALFRDAHYIEVAQTLVRLREGAYELAGRPHGPQEVSRAVTSAGLVMAYTIGPGEADANLVVHYISLSRAGRLTQMAVGESFGLFVMQVLEMPLEGTARMVSQNRVFHMYRMLTPAEDAAVRARPVQVPALAEVKALRAAGTAIRDAQGPIFEQIKVEAPQRRRA